MFLSLPKTLRAGLVALLTCCAAARAGELASVPAVPPAPEKDKTLAEITENLGRLYHSDTDPILQELWFLGRYHGQYHWSDGSNGEDEGYENRRFRIGGQARLFRNLTLHAQMVSSNDLESIYGGFTELWAAWRFSDAFILSVGQQKHRFTHDRNVSSRYINYLERSQLTNMFGLDYTPAVTISGRRGNWNYYGGVFSNATGTNMGESFTDLDSGYSLLAAATLDLGDLFGTDTAHWNMGYLYSEANENATNMFRFDHGLASALILTEGPFSLVTEGLIGIGGNGGSAAGLNIQPAWFITDKLQLATRYQVAFSEEDNGLRAQRRYERNAGLSTGDLYQAVYAGLNYHVAAHRLKVMAGAEYATIGGEDVWTFSVMWRCFWGPHSRGPFPMAHMLKGTWR